MFKEFPESWKMLSHVGRCSNPDPEKPLSMVSSRKTEPNFERLISCLPKELQPFIDKFYLKIGVQEYF